MVVRSVNLVKGEITISYLPLSHIAAQLVDIYAPITCGATVFFAQPDALKVSRLFSYVPRQSRWYFHINMT